MDAELLAGCAAAAGCAALRKWDSEENRQVQTLSCWLVAQLCSRSVCKQAVPCRSHAPWVCSWGWPGTGVLHIRPGPASSTLRVGWIGSEDTLHLDERLKGRLCKPPGP